ncbi:Na+/H+ antiporter NhaD/arsenite permease-like protein [Rhodanobacter sp. ANJX3]|jgi:Na+/H+ antiporter NhaD/arsenite permease-like protein|uniref:SLC13 family permease n=1 Tax=Rhodanobacter sp. ANJX3 TaxID=2723083 RepID=UPI00161D4F96|nr:SLC13 family permease [Rhodanobacter sp. ANJX3]MBB5360397.1 Na+/H+ antiporter NhaD/arsenite permease-like protein [Rhodanobacter sp. ANJX3]
MSNSAVSKTVRLTWHQKLKSEWLLVVFGTLTILLALIDPQPLSRYHQWLQLPTLAGLMGLLIAIQGIRDSGLVQRAAVGVVARAHSLRGLGLLLVAATAIVSMVLTNDVSLFLIVPLTVAIGGMSNLPVLRMVVLEALAVNAGSTLSPIGNPQNLLLWQHAKMPFLHFVLGMLPAAVVMFALLAAFTLLWLPRGSIELSREKMDGQTISRRLGMASMLALAGMVVAMEYDQAALGAAALLALFALLARASLARIDWLLLVTFAAIFLGLGHFAELPLIEHALDQFDFKQPLTVFLGGILASQVISNVPATVLLLDRTPDAIALAVAANVGGFGLAIGSLANLIALRLAKQPHGLRLLHLVSIPFLLVSAPLVYLAWRLLG